MAFGEGKYDDLVELVRTRARAGAAMVIVIDGSQGHGFSISMPGPVVLAVPAVLRDMANQIEKMAPGVIAAEEAKLKTKPN